MSPWFCGSTSFFSGVVAPTTVLLEPTLDYQNLISCSRESEVFSNHAKNKIRWPDLSMAGRVAYHPSGAQMSIVAQTWTLRRQNFLPKGPGGRNFRRKKTKCRSGGKTAETQQALRHAETCFCKFPPISRRIPTISRLIAPISCCHFLHRT